MHLRENKVFLTDPEQAALGTALNPVPAEAIWSVWHVAMHETVGLVEGLRDAASEDIRIVDGGAFVGPTITRGPVAQRYEAASKRLDVLDAMSHSAIAISMETV